MSRLRTCLVTIFVIGLLAGCDLPDGWMNLPLPGSQATAGPALSPTPVPVADQVETVSPPEASATPSGPATSIPPTLNPTQLNLPTVTATPTLDPTDMLLRIAVPGPMSKVVSPIDLVVYVSPLYIGATRIQLFGEDGSELYSKSFHTFSNNITAARVEEKINFQIHGVAEMGRLQISTADTFGRMQAFNSVRVLLLSVGDTELTQADPAVERVVLRTPKKDDVIGGGILKVVGEIQPINNTPVFLDLLDTQGNVIGSRILTLQPVDGTYQVFDTTVPYQIGQTGQKVPARLLIRQNDDRLSGLAYLYSVAVLVGP